MKFTSVQDLKDAFNASLQFVPSEFGFVEPGHGLKGKQKWIHDNVDLEEMYSCYAKKNDFLLWCYTIVGGDTSPRHIGQKRASSGDTKSTAPRTKSTCLRKISEVEEIIKDLQERHGTGFSIEQFSMWAHIIHIGKHSSRETPPDQPFFRESHKNTAHAIPNASSSVGISPGKCVSLRSECINQLDKWHSLLEKGIISQEQYDDMKKTNLHDMFKF